jgi:hypothetical protein
MGLDNGGLRVDVYYVPCSYVLITRTAEEKVVIYTQTCNCIKMRRVERTQNFAGLEGHLAHTMIATAVVENVIIF